LVIIINSNIL